MRQPGSADAAAAPPWRRTWSRPSTDTGVGSARTPAACRTRPLSIGGWLASYDSATPPAGDHVGWRWASPLAIGKCVRLRSGVGSDLPTSVSLAGVKECAVQPASFPFELILKSLDDPHRHRRAQRPRPARKSEIVVVLTPLARASSPCVTPPRSSIAIRSRVGHMPAPAPSARAYGNAASMIGRPGPPPVGRGSTDKTDRGGVGVSPYGGSRARMCHPYAGSRAPEPRATGSPPHERRARADDASEGVAPLEAWGRRVRGRRAAVAASVAGREESQSHCVYQTCA